METTKITKQYYAILTTRNYLPDYDEEGYQVGRRVVLRNVYLIQSNDFEKLDKEINDIARGCDEAFDVSVDESQSMKRHRELLRGCDCE